MPSIHALTPVVSCEVPPLQDTLAAGETQGELEPHLEHLLPWPRVELWSFSISLLQEVSVQAGLGGRHERVVLGTEPELEVSHVVGRQLYPHLDALVLLVDPGDHTPPKLPPSLIISRLLLVPRVPTHPALTTVSLPLTGEAPAVALVVVVVGRVVEAVPPHGGPGGGLYQPAVGPGGGGRVEEGEEEW